ncbi:MAG: TIGR03790 family protein [Kiritimatiellia bacterium]
MMNRFFRFLAPVLLPALAFAGAGPMDTLVVVNGASRDSRALGAYYAEKHGLPPSHVCTVKTDPRSPSISRKFFESEIRQPIIDHLARHKLDGQIHFLVLCMDIPSRVENANGITAALFYGFKSPAPDAPQCNVAPESVNQYYAAETAYSSAAGWNRTNAPIPFLLTAADLDTAKQVVDRAVAANASFPDGVFCLYGSGDGARNVRHRTYPVVARHFHLFGKGNAIETHPGASPVPARPILGYLTGLAYLPTNLAGAVFAPGAIGDHLTSCAGQIPDPCLGQSSVWDWMRLGATASYGTVSEPCSFEVKFPDPMVAFWYARGFCAGEALAMSVRNPYQGIWVGDPLAAPFAAPPSVRIESPARNAELDGEVLLQISAAAHEKGAPPVFLDLYLDGRLHAPVVRPFVPVGNELVAQIGTNRFSYAVAPDEDLFAAAAGLAWAINYSGNGQITASAKSDRIEISVRQPRGEDGQPLPFSVSTEQGFANAVYVGATAGTNRLVPDGDVGRAAAALHLGDARTFEIEYPLDLSPLEPGPHVLTLVVRDGTAMQCQSQTELPFRVPERP